MCACGPCATHEKAIKIAPFFLFQFRTSKQAFILHYLAFAKIAYFGEKSLLGLLPETAVEYRTWPRIGRLVSHLSAVRTAMTAASFNGEGSRLRS